MSTPSTLQQLLAPLDAGAVALAAPGATPLSFGTLRTQIAEMVETLNKVGIGRNDRVAIVLPNGPEMATAFLAVASAAASAPLNPGYRAEEFEFYLTDLKARALIVQQGIDTPAVAVADKLGVPVFHLHPLPDQGAGRFRLDTGGMGVGNGRVAGGYAETDDVALVLHTSGTTSRPKIVPLRQRNICASARNIRTTCRFAPEDRGLNIMPLFHIHGLIAGITAPLSAGSSVFCTPGLQRAEILCLDGGEPPDLVHRRADHAPGDPDARRTQCRDHQT